MWCSLPDGRTLIREELGRYQQRVPRHSPTHPTRLLGHTLPEAPAAALVAGPSGASVLSAPPHRRAQVNPSTNSHLMTHESCLAASRASAMPPMPPERIEGPARR